MAVGGHRELVAATEDVEAVAEFLGVERLAQLHRAEALGKVDVAPAVLLLHFEEAEVEVCVVGDEEGIFCEVEELREDHFHGGRVCDFFICDLIHPARFEGDIALGVDERGERFFAQYLAVFQPHTGDFDDAVTLPRVESGCLNIKNREGWERRHVAGLY